MATSRSSRVLLLVLWLWTIFGSWALFSRDAGDGLGIHPGVGHVVVFFFVSLAAFGLTMRNFGRLRGLAVGTVGIAAAAGVSEWLQPILTDTRLAQREDLFADGIGIVAAILASYVLIEFVRDDRTRAWMVVGVCSLGLGASVAVTLVGLERAHAAEACGGLGYHHLDDLVGDPIIHVDEATVRIAASRSGAAASESPLGDGLISPDSSDLRCSVIRGGGYSIVATVVPDSADSTGPRRIFTSSIGTSFAQQNTHLGQEFASLSVRIRTDDGFGWLELTGVFEPGQVTTIGLTVGDGRAVVFVDGERAANIGLPGSTFVEWDPDVPILVGDEFTRDRTFEGRIVSVAVFDRALDPDDPALQPER